MSKLLCTAFAAAALAASSIHAAGDSTRARQLAAQSACLACHSATMRLVGPSYREVAAKYQGMDALKLASSIKAGGKGKWGPIDMPPQPGLSEGEAKLLADWVLAGGPDN